MKIDTIIINQYFGCGDLIFCQSIARDFVCAGYKVLWPVTGCYAPLAKHFPDIVMVDKALVNIDYTRTDEYEFNGCKVIPLRFTDSLCKVPYTQCMQSKYLYFNKDWQTWKDNCRIRRDYANERKLYSEVLGLAVGEKYNLISEQFGTAGLRTAGVDIPDNGLKNVHMKFIDGFTLIDWMMVIENAHEIFAVSSSNIYLFELYPLKAKKINLYIRKPIELNHDNYAYLLQSHNYILHP